MTADPLVTVRPPTVREAQVLDEPWEPQEPGSCTDIEWMCDDGPCTEADRVKWNELNDRIDIKNLTVTPDDGCAHTDSAVVIGDGPGYWKSTHIDPIEQPTWLVAHATNIGLAVIVILAVVLLTVIRNRAEFDPIYQEFGGDEDD